MDRLFCRSKYVLNPRDPVARLVYEIFSIARLLAENLSSFKVIKPKLLLYYKLTGCIVGAKYKPVPLVCR
jgi:hypothetical protein